MASQIKISADTSDAKKSILDLSKTVKDVKSSNVSIFTADDKKFIRRELNSELGLMKTKLKDNQQEITKLVSEQQKLKKGSDEELRIRNKITQAYKTQKRLAKEIQDTQKSSNQLSRSGQISQGVGAMNKGLGGRLGRMGGVLGVGALAAGALGLPLAFNSTRQYMGGAGKRTRATGLGLEERSQMSPEEIAESGLTEQQLLDRRVQMGSIVGRGAGNERDVLQQAKFERAYGLEEGQLANTAGSLRSAFGEQANEAQMKLQASVMASGMEDAIGPYLETMSGLLSAINENGMQNTDELINAVAQMSIGERTPEQVARTFQTVDQSVRGSSGEANAFLQMAMARGGIGGGTIGGSRFALESGGIMGLDREELEGRGYNPELLSNLGGMGMFGGMGDRTGAIIDQFKKSAGLGGDQSIGDVTDPGQMFALSNLANNVLGTEGMGGFDALQMMEKVQQGQMSKEKFDERLKELKEGKSPQVERLDKINSTLAGQTEVLTDIKENLMERIGQAGVEAGVELQRANVGRVRAQGEVVKGGAGAVAGGMKAISNPIDYLSKGKLGGDIYDFFNKPSTIDKSNGPRLHPKTGMPYDTDAYKKQKEAEIMTKAVKQGVIEGSAATKGKGLSNKTTVNVKTVLPDGKVSNSTYKAD